MLLAVRRSLLATSALAGVAAWAGPAALAADVTPGGAVDITISGFARGLAIGGDVDNIRLSPTFSTGLDFFNDTEVHVLLKGKHDATGIEYGGTVEFEADTNATSNTDETWLFVRSGFGEIRFGDEDGVSDSDGLAVSANTISQDVGTGGLDGDQFEVLAGSVKTFESTGTSDATKIRYATPSYGGVQLGVSYTPNLNAINGGGGNGDLLAPKDVAAGDVVEAGVRYKGKLGALGLTAGLTGLYGDVKDEDVVGGDDYWEWQAGAVVEIAGIRIGGSYLQEEIGAIEASAVTVGVGTDIGPVRLALTYGRFLSTDDLVVNDNELDEPYVAILSGTVGLLPGLTLAGDVGYFDNDVSRKADDFPGDDGWQGVARLGLAF